MIVTPLGDADNAKLGWAEAFTVSEIVVPSLRLAETPVIVMVAVPVVAAEPAVRVMTLEVVAGFVPKDAVTPAGNPDAESVTLPANPFEGVIAIVLVPPAPWVIVRLLGEGESSKLGAPEEGHAFTRLAAFTEPIPVAKSQPLVVP